MVITLRGQDDFPTDFEPWIKQFGLIRFFGSAFGKDTDGGFPHHEEEKIDKLVEICTKYNQKVIWSILITSFTLEKELSYIKWLIKTKKVPIVAFELGGEYYLPKYRKGDVDNHKVLEQILVTKDRNDYTNMLGGWIDALQSGYPQIKLILIGASHGSSSLFRDKYRAEWNKQLFEYATTEYPDTEFYVSYHYYAGNNKGLSDPNEEDVITPDKIDLGFLKTLPERYHWICTESGYWPTGSAKEDKEMIKAFFDAQKEALGDEDIMGVHTLYQKKSGSPYALYDREGLTEMGEVIKEWCEENFEPNVAPTLASITSNDRTLFGFMISFRQRLVFSDGSVIYNSGNLFAPYVYYTSSQIGLPKPYFT